MWDPEQLAEIPVLVDHLQARGDPLGEWLALRQLLDGGGLPRDERARLHRRVRALRASLGAQLTLGDDPRSGRPHVIRDRGLIKDVSFRDVRPESLARVLARSDAPFVLRLRLRGTLESLRACVELLRGAPLARARASLRELALESVDARDPDLAPALHPELTRARAELGVEFPSLYALDVDGVAVALPLDPAILEGRAAWTPALRVGLGRALASDAPALRRRSLERLREHGVDAAQLRAPLMAIIADDRSPEVRAAAFALIPGLGQIGHALIVLAKELADERDDPQLRAWLGRR